MKSAFIITSALNTRFGVYTPEQRLEQTLATIKSVRERNPGAKIFAVELAGVTPTDEQRATMEAAQAGTKDMQQVHTDIVINYRLNADKVAIIYKDFGLDLVNKVLAPSLNEAFKSVTGHYTSEELITKRDEVSAGILEHVRSKLAQFDISVDSVSLVNFGFSAEYQKAIEAKVIATQMKQKAEMDLQRIQVEAQQAIAKAEGEAKAIAIQSQAIQSQGGAAYVQLKAIEKWDGNLPNVMSGAVPFINVSK